MKRSQIIQQLSGCLNQISQLQTQGIVQLTNKVSFALSKNLNKCKGLQTDFNQFQKDKIKEYCNCDIHGQPKMIDVPQEGGKPIKKWDYKEPDSEEKMQNDFNSYLEEDVLFIPHTISRAEIEIIHNIPIGLISTLDEFGIIGEPSKVLTIN